MSRANTDRRIVLWLAGGVLLLVMIVASIAPASADDNAMPSTDNTGTHGAKAAFLLLQNLGYSVDRSTNAATGLDGLDAAHTTYILAEPNVPGEATQKRDYAAVERFLNRGGRVLATGFAGAHFLPGGRTGEPTQMFGGLCNTQPEGAGMLAQVGSFATYDRLAWSAAEPAVRVDARCGADAVVVHRPYANGGEFVWWSSAEPLTNRGIAQDSSLQLLLASIGPAGARRIVFDEFYHGEQGSTSDYLKGLPLRSLGLQVGLVVVLLLFSYSRRSGPLRDPVRVPRTSPIEFVRNMGALYERAGATKPATEAARRRLHMFLLQSCGIEAGVLQGSAGAIASAVHARFSIDAQPLEAVLERLDAARYERLRPREALLVVRAADAEIVRLLTLTQPKRSSSLTTLTVSETL
jgi:hypothetical protein